MKKNSVYVEKFTTLLKSLETYGLINGLFYDDNVISFAFKNAQVKRCLTSSGRLLELIVTVNAMSVTEKNGKPVYNDVKTGVCIDWDGVIGAEYEADVSNEVDVVLMKGLTPVFISCKNGSFDSNELYKLSVVAERFGGKYARKVIVASESVESSSKGKYLRARADDMDIKIIDDFDNMPRAEIERVFKTFWMGN